MLFQENNNYRRPVFHLLYSFLFSNAYSDYQHISIPLLIFNIFVFVVFIFVPYLVEIVFILYPSLPADLYGFLPQSRPGRLQISCLLHLARTVIPSTRLCSASQRSSSVYNIRLNSGDSDSKYSLSIITHTFCILYLIHIRIYLSIKFPFTSMQLTLYILVLQLILRL